MGKVKKMTVQRKLVIIGCDKDFGFGKGVIAEETVDYSDVQDRGFDSSMFMATLIQGEEDMIKKHVKVVSKEVKQKVRRGKK